MSQAIIVKIGFETYVLPFKAGTAGKLMELLSQAVPCHEKWTREGSTLTLRPEAIKLEIKFVDTSKILPPEAKDYEGSDVSDIMMLPGAVKLLRA